MSGKGEGTAESVTNALIEAAFQNEEGKIPENFESHVGIWLQDLRKDSTEASFMEVANTIVRAYFPSTQAIPPNFQQGGEGFNNVVEALVQGYIAANSTGKELSTNGAGDEPSKPRPDVSTQSSAEPTEIRSLDIEGVGGFATWQSLIHAEYATSYQEHDFGGIGDCGLRAYIGALRSLSAAGGRDGEKAGEKLEEWGLATKGLSVTTEDTDILRKRMVQLAKEEYERDPENFPAKFLVDTDGIQRYRDAESYFLAMEQTGTFLRDTELALLARHDNIRLIFRETNTNGQLNYMSLGSVESDLTLAIINDKTPAGIPVHFRAIVPKAAALVAQDSATRERELRQQTEEAKTQTSAQSTSSSMTGQSNPTASSASKKSNVEIPLVPTEWEEQVDYASSRIGDPAQQSVNASTSNDFPNKKATEARSASSPNAGNSLSGSSTKPSASSALPTPSMVTHDMDVTPIDTSGKRQNGHKKPISCQEYTFSVNDDNRAFLQFLANQLASDTSWIGALTTSNSYEKDVSREHKVDYLASYRTGSSGNLLNKLSVWVVEGSEDLFKRYVQILRSEFEKHKDPNYNEQGLEARRNLLYSKEPVPSTASYITPPATPAATTPSSTQSAPANAQPKPPSRPTAPPPKPVQAAPTPLVEPPPTNSRTPGLIANARKMEVAAAQHANQKSASAASTASQPNGGTFTTSDGKPPSRAALTTTAKAKSASQAQPDLFALHVQTVTTQVGENSTQSASLGWYAEAVNSPNTQGRNDQLNIYKKRPGEDRGQEILYSTRGTDNTVCVDTFRPGEQAAFQAGLEKANLIMESNGNSGTYTIRSLRKDDVAAFVSAFEQVFPSSMPNDKKFIKVAFTPEVQTKLEQHFGDDVKFREFVARCGAYNMNPAQMPQRLPEAVSPASSTPAANKAASGAAGLNEQPKPEPTPQTPSQPSRNKPGT